MKNLFLLLAAGNGFLAVMFGAFGAHALAKRLSPAMLGVYQTGVQYQMFHVVALLAVGFLLQRGNDSPLLPWSGYLFAAGIVLFSGSLYGLSLSGIRALGMITPVGGVAFLAGWALLFVGLLGHKQ
ncbi:MAG: DUF423 domain-containing protein [Pseudomonadales bacterium]|nr:DUF423 domain-containing protein [Pseudomonadales bacterium]